MAYIKGVDRRQTALFPKALDDYISDDNPVRLIDAFVDRLDLIGLGFKHAEPAATGRPAYHPSDLLKLFLYGSMNGIPSTRHLEKETRRNLEVMWLLRRLMPDFKTIADFRKDHLAGIKLVRRRFFLLCRELERRGGELMGIDRIPVRSVASREPELAELKLRRALQDLGKDLAGYYAEAQKAAVVE